MVKKVVSFLMVLMMTISLVACGQSTNNSKDSSETDSKVTETTNTSQQSSSNKKILIAYFSWSGNTKKMANTIKENVGGDILEIKPSNPYPTDYSECGDVAKEERDNNARPKIANLPKSIDEYDTIFIGYPIWWHTAPMIIGTFLESYDLTGKDVYPFTQSAAMDNEHFENSMKFVKQSAKNATVHDGLYVNASETNEIISYLNKNGFGK